MISRKYLTIIISLFIGLILGVAITKLVEVKINVYPKIRWDLSKKLLKNFSIKNPIDILELCYFENQNKIRMIEVSNAMIERSQEQVNQGNYSLKCVFREGGGAIGFYDILPKNWTGYASFLFDVYTDEESIPLSLFLTDENNVSYGDRYNRENILLKRGWNIIHIPISEIDSKLILDRIKHLRLFLWKVKGEHALYFDNLRLTHNNVDVDINNNDLDAPITITINPTKEKMKISPLLYGSNLSPKMESDSKIIDFIREMGITCFRYPGGGSIGWHWKTGLADFSEKVKNMPLANIDYLIEFCKKTNTKLIMQVNVESGTPRETAELVDFINKKNNFRVDYWELGNEVYGNWDKAHATPEKYAELIKEYSIAMKAVDSTIKIGANWGERYYDSIKWDETIIRSAADYIDFVSIHWYPNHINNSHKYQGRIHPTPEEVMANALEIPNIVKRFQKIVERWAAHRKGKIEVTFLEWDGSWDAPSSDPEPPYAQGVMQWSLANAIFYADCLGLFAEHGVAVSAHYNLQECMFGLIRGWDPAEGWGGMKWDMQTIRPKAFALEMFAKHFGDILIESNLENPPSYSKQEDWWPSSYTGEVPYVTCYASKFSSNNKLGIIFINKHSQQDFKIKVNIDNSLKVNNVAKVWVLNGPDVMSQNDGQPGTVIIKKFTVDNIQNQFGYTLPAHSIVAMELEIS